MPPPFLHINVNSTSSIENIARFTNLRSHKLYLGGHYNDQDSYRKVLSITANLLTRSQSYLTVLEVLNLSFGFWDGYKLNDPVVFDPETYIPLEQALMQPKYLEIENFVFTCSGGIHNFVWDSAFKRMFPTLWQRRELRMYYG